MVERSDGAGRILVRAPGTTLALPGVMHRFAFMAVGLLALAQGCAEFDGESYEPVVSGNEVEIHDELPDDHFRIGSVDADEEHTVDGNDPIERALWCDADRPIRKMKRVAARNGGEVLYDVFCEYDEVEDDSWLADDPETWHVESVLTCSMWCSAEVGRRDDRE